MKRRKRLPGGALGELEEVFSAQLTEREKEFVTTIERLETQNGELSETLDMILTDIIPTLLGGE